MCSFFPRNYRCGPCGTRLWILSSASSHEGTVAATNKLIYDRGVKFIVGPTAFWGKASGPICEANKVFNVIGFCTNTPGELDKTTQYRFLGTNGTMGNFYGIKNTLKKPTLTLRAP